MGCRKLAYYENQNLKIYRNKESFRIVLQRVGHYDESKKKGLDCYDYGWRMYDPAIARWHVQDPRAEKYESGVHIIMYLIIQ